MKFCDIFIEGKVFKIVIRKVAKNYGIPKSTVIFWNAHDYAKKKKKMRQEEEKRMIAELQEKSKLEKPKTKRGKRG